MGRKVKFISSEKLHYVKLHLIENYPINHLARILSIHKTTVEQCIRNYQAMGIEGLNVKDKNTKYSYTQKINAVEEYLTQNNSITDVCKKFKIRSNKTLLDWIKLYNNGKQLKSSNSGGTIMTKGRRTSCEERIEIIQYCIENKYDYAKTAQQFQVSYQQVYSWIKKYNKNGVDALQDKRGKRKPESEMTETEKLRANNKLLEAQLEQKEMEIEFLKKLDEVERRLSSAKRRTKSSIYPYKK